MTRPHLAVSPGVMMATAEEEDNPVVAAGEAEEVDEDSSQKERLRERMSVAVINIMNNEAQKQGVTISPEVVSAFCHCTHAFAEQLARDLKLFAQHAKRSKVTVDDVLLAARRNESLHASLKATAKELTDEAEKASKKKKRKLLGDFGS
eukprot:jgi/Mesen1/6548/ME000334S05888